MLKLGIAGAIIAFAVMVFWHLYSRYKQAQRRQRQRRANRHWTGYAKAWDAVFNRQRVRRITYIEPIETAEPCSVGADGGT